MIFSAKCLVLKFLVTTCTVSCSDSLTEENKHFLFMHDTVIAANISLQFFQPITPSVIPIFLAIYFGTHCQIL